MCNNSSTITPYPSIKMTIIADDITSVQRTPIQEFYADQKVFITGGTGFLGKILIEKLLRSCPELSTIYLLIRTKKGKDVHNRLDDVFKDPIFDRLKSEQPKYRHKIVVVSGDCSLPNLGLYNDDRDLLIREASIVFHVAATVRFDEQLKYAVAINVNGTKEVLDMCRSMYNLKSVVYVSTAYSNCNRSIIEEKIYSPPISGDTLGKLTEGMDEAKLNKITPTLLGDYPNTYVFTKAIAESTAKEYGKDLPLGIFRPAMVISTAHEPIEGWIDNVFGPTGGIVGAGAGLIRTFNVDSECTAELVPVDMTVNALVATAWDIAMNKNITTEPPTYNYVATTKKKNITWGEYNNFALKYGTLRPSTRSIWCYVNYSTKYVMLYNVLTVLLHLLPALLLDTGLVLTGQSPKMLKIYKKIHKFASCTSYFARRSWKFQTDNTQALWDKLATEDKNNFFFSMEDFDWDSYMNKYITGLRKYIFKDDPSSIPAARKRMAVMKVFHNIIVYSFLAFVIWICYKLVWLGLSLGHTAGTTYVNENIAAFR
ncbi:fatty acyl-CoA reductase wat-like isoform X1 [Neodiprion virginianus]|uniref:fatty acyl-CoA reductase wat-like isoform X1 n=2 Tax=Neodiprion virginianus TaxID=2961670 RepID=UPI001EE6F85C|nr:fatty acyl-CoA reductase wat-like isoform X1 [Neodiprion virginianus]